MCAAIRCCIPVPTHTRQIDLEVAKASCSQMYVGIVEARHHKVAAKIDNLRVSAFQLADIIVPSDGKDAAIAHRHRLRSWWRCLRVNVAIEEDSVGWLAAGRLI